MLSNLRPRKLSCAAVTRIVLAGLLSLTLLSGIVPTGALTSTAQQTCTMSCCVGKPPHAPGSCGAAFSEAEHHSDAEQQGASATETIEATSHCGTATAHTARNEESSPKASSRRASKSETILTAHVLTTPCSPECAAAAATAFSHARRAPDTAALAATKRPFAHGFASLAEHTVGLQKLSAAQGRQASPRAPPAAL
ncbi:MAG TPA: hypothetical protein VF544_06890 [Pyrinomonadaceae bacterium]